MSIHSIGELLRAYVLADATVAGLVSTRMYPLRLPQKVTFPALVYQRISDERVEHLHGIPSAADPRYQIDAWADTYDEALALGGAVRERLDAFVGTWTDGIVTATVAIRLTTQRDLFEEDILGGKCRHSADYFITHGTDGGAI